MSEALQFYDVGSNRALSREYVACHEDVWFGCQSSSPRDCRRHLAAV